MLVLPPALDEKKQIQLFKSLPDKKARDKLIEHNMRLVVYISKKFSNTGFSEDLVSIGTLGLIKAVDNFSLEKNIAFQTFATRCIENEILMFLRRNKKHQDNISLQSILYNTEDNYNNLHLEDILINPNEEIFTEKCETMYLLSDIITYALNCFSHRDCLIFLYWMAGKQQREIAKLLDFNLSQSYISRLQRKLFKQLSEVGTFDSNKFSDYFSITNNFYVLKLSKKRICLKDLKRLFLEVRRTSEFLEVRQTSEFLEIRMPKRDKTFLLMAKIKMLQK